MVTQVLFLVPRIIDTIGTIFSTRIPGDGSLNTFVAGTIFNTHTTVYYTYFQIVAILIAVKDIWEYGY